MLALERHFFHSLGGEYLIKKPLIYSKGQRFLKNIGSYRDSSTFL